MKRIVAILLCLILMGTLALSASAAGSAHMSLSSSASTVYRGDSFTITVSLTNDQPVSNGGIVLSYDSSVFELTGGSCNVSNATLAEVSAANGGGVFLLQSDAVVSGTIFTINMKVKSNAASGSYTISGTPNLTVQEGGEKVSASATVDSVTVTVDGGETQPTEQETTAATTEPAQSTATEPSQSATTEPTQSATTEPTQSATSEATNGETVEVTTEDPEILPTKGEQTEAPTEILTIGATTPTPQKTGFPWWIIFAVMGIGSIIAIVIIQKKS